MSRFIEYYWPADDNAGVALQQSIVAAGANLKLNGPYADPVTGVVDFRSKGFSRNISITAHLGGLNNKEFTITGTQNGCPVVITVDGPRINNTDQIEDIFFDTITSITSDTGGVVGVSIGIGNSGFFPLIPINLEGSKTVINYSLGFITEISLQDPQPGRYYTILGGLNNITSGFTYIDLFQKNLIVPIFERTNANTIKVMSSNNVYQNILIAVGNDDINPDSTLRMQFLQL